MIFENFDRYEHWLGHVEMVTRLLDLRGLEQFHRERGGQLFVQIRSQIVSLAVASLQILSRVRLMIAS